VKASSNEDIMKSKDRDEDIRKSNGPSSNNSVDPSMNNSMNNAMNPSITDLVRMGGMNLDSTYDMW
jgi:hypothetical protein